MTVKPEIVDLMYFRDDGHSLIDSNYKWYVVRARMKDGRKYTMNACASSELVDDEPMFREVIASQLINIVLEAAQ